VPGFRMSCRIDRRHDPLPGLWWLVWSQRLHSHQAVSGTIGEVCHAELRTVLSFFKGEIPWSPYKYSLVGSCVEARFQDHHDCLPPHS
jgi:hypothetical protein